MAILDFWRKRRANKIKRLSLNEQILRLKQDFQEEIRDFEHFKQLQIKKIEILRTIKELWSRQWKEAEELIRKDIPKLIIKQLGFINLDIQYIHEEDFILIDILEFEGKTVLGNYLIKGIRREHLEDKRVLSNHIFLYLLRNILTENSKILREEYAKLNKNLYRQLDFLKSANVWMAINENEKFLEYLKEEEALTITIGAVINDISKKVSRIIEIELERIKEGKVYSKIISLLSSEERREAKLLTSPVYELRVSGILKLMKLNSEKSIPLIEQMLNDPDADVRRAASEALATLSEETSHHRLYSQITDKKFFNAETPIIRGEFEKTGSRTILLGGVLTGKVIIRIISEKGFLAWKKALESKDAWKKAGFDYVPIEPVLIKNGKYRVKKFIAKKAKDPKHVKWFETEHGGEVLYAVYTKVLGNSLFGFYNNPKNSKFIREVEDAISKIDEVLYSLEIHHGHLSHNVCVNIDNNKPRIYVIDFDQAMIT